MEIWPFDGAIMREIMRVAKTDYIEPEAYDKPFQSTGHKMNDFECQAFTVLVTYGQQLLRIDEELECDNLSASYLETLAKSKKIVVNVFESVNFLLIHSLRDRLNIWEEYPWVSKGFEVILVNEIDLLPDEALIAVSVADARSIEQLGDSIRRLEEKKALEILEKLDDSEMTPQ